MTTRLQDIMKLDTQSEDKAPGKYTMERKISETYRHSIFEHDNIRNFLKYCHFDSFVVFDLDNTLVESTKELGSDQWFGTLMSQACKISSDPKTRELVLNLYFAVQHHTTLKSVEDKSILLIKALQDIGIPVLALSARSIPIIKPTLSELQRVGIHLERQWDQTLHLTIEGKRSAAIFKDGVIFCNNNDKGLCLQAFFETIKYFPKHVLMIDDQEKNLKSVAKIVNDYSGKFSGVHYRFLDKKAAQINMDNAAQQLEKMIQNFSSEERVTAVEVCELLKKNKM